MPNNVPIAPIQHPVPHGCRMTARTMWLLAGTTLLLLALWQVSVTHAESPPGETTPSRRRPLLPNHPIRLSAGDIGPFFSLNDLASYTPVPRSTPPTWEIRPPIWQGYPPEIQTIPFVHRDYPAETVSYLATHEIRHGDRTKPAMALTFDCETGYGSTVKILDTLRDRHAAATFFILGRYAYMYPEIVQRIAADGHEIGSHSFTHPLFTAIEPITATSEITYTEAVIDWALGRHLPMRYIRFPYGGKNDAIRQHAARLGYQSAFWNIDPRGWEPGKSPSDVVDHIRRTAHNGGIVIMHCGSWTDADALGDVIDVLDGMGIHTGTFTDVLAAEDRDVPHYPKRWP
jgi:peptidoglycan/xylan/chitin deacetylase (PgdA/CDA1 family)